MFSVDILPWTTTEARTGAAHERCWNLGWNDDHNA
ncbi:hypothetical protein WG66_000280, partial [Moniliophthora roreri]